MSWHPKVIAAAKELNKRVADSCNVNADDQWALEGGVYISDADAMLKAAGVRFDAPIPAPEGGPALVQRITNYLADGGLFNPELAKHDAVRDLLIECRAALAAQPSANNAMGQTGCFPDGEKTTAAPAEGAVPESARQALKLGKLTEAVARAIAFADSGSTEDWAGCVDLAEAAIRVCDARNPPRCSHCHSATSQPVESGFVRVVEESDYGKPYAAAQYAQAEARAVLEPVVAALSNPEPKGTATLTITAPNGDKIVAQGSALDMATLEKVIHAKTQSPAPAQPAMPGRDWLEGMVDAWRTNAAEHDGDGWHTSADAFRTCAADLERALRLNPREALPSPAVGAATDDFAAHTVLSGVARHKVNDLIASGYRICGYTMERPGHRSAVVFDAAVRWLTEDQRHTLMFVEGARVVGQPATDEQVRDAFGRWSCSMADALWLVQTPLERGERTYRDGFRDGERAHGITAFGSKPPVQGKS